MKKATGPAKVEASPTSPGSPVSEVLALLFNFDFDDAAVKPEHQAWLPENLIPQLVAEQERADSCEDGESGRQRRPQPPIFPPSCRGGTYVPHLQGARSRRSS